MRPSVKPGTTVAGFGLSRLARWAPTLVLWGGAAGLGLFYFAERIPLFRQDIYSNLPLVGGRWKKLVEEAAAQD